MTGVDHGRDNVQVLRTRAVARDPAGTIRVWRRGGQHGIITRSFNERGGAGRGVSWEAEAEQGPGAAGLGAAQAPELT